MTKFVDNIQTEHCIYYRYSESWYIKINVHLKIIPEKKVKITFLIIHKKMKYFNGIYNVQYKHNKICI